MRIAFLTLILAAAACSSTQRTGNPGTPAAAANPAMPANRGLTAGATVLTKAIGLAQDPRIAAMLRDVDPARIRVYDSTLVAFGTRNTYSDSLSATRGTGAARRWIHSQFSRFSADCGGCLRVSFDTATAPTPRNRASPTRFVTNVIAHLPGRDTMRVIVIGGHYDSCLCAVPANGGGRDSTSDAPGANDDGSGTSAVIELARVFSRAYPQGLEVSAMFVAHDAEEQGLLGSAALAKRLKAEGKLVVAGMTDDIVGNVTAEDGYTDSLSVRVFSPDPDTSKSRELARYVWGVGALYLPGFEVFPVFRLDRVGRGGDHRSFIEQGFAGVRFTERVENEKRQHRPEDLLSGVNFGYVANVARLNAATIAALGQAPGIPDSTRARRDVPVTGGRRWILQWSPVKGAVGYEVLVRRTTSPQYELVYPAAGTTFELNYQLDDAWAGIRAIGANGHRGLTAVLPRVVPRPTQPDP
jgi:hypothetical protein